MTESRYRGLTKKDMVIVRKDDAKINIIVGQINDKKDPVRATATKV